MPGHGASAALPGFAAIVCLRVGFVSTLSLCSPMLHASRCRALACPAGPVGHCLASAFSFRSAA
eukprot:15087184-Alexandrium_andersonii.AAC.1